MAPNLYDDYGLQILMELWHLGIGSDDYHPPIYCFPLN
jgi:hypothetical protein